MPYECNRCGETHCSKHRLPEKHSCSMLDRGGVNSQIIVEAKKNNSRGSKGLGSSLESLVSSLIPEDLSRKLDGNMTKMFGGAMIIVYILQFVALSVGGTGLHNTLFVLSPDKVHHVWTWFTSMFAHSPSSLFHIIGNGMVLYFFGTLLEKILGTRRYVELFLVSGLLAGLGQVGFGILIGNPVGVLGASGALMGVLGVMTVYKPKLTVYLYFIIPMPLWLITLAFVGFSIGGLMVSSGVVGGGIAHGAHLIGLIVGLMYGYKTQDEYDISSKVQLIGNNRVR